MTEAILASLVFGYAWTGVAIVWNDTRRHPAERPAYARGGFAVLALGAATWPIRNAIRHMMGPSWSPRSIAIGVWDGSLRLIINSAAAFGLYAASGLIVSSMWIRLILIMVLVVFPPTAILIGLVRRAAFFLVTAVTMPLVLIFPTNEEPQ